MDPNFALRTIDEGGESSLIGFDFPSHANSMLATPQASSPRPVVVDEGQENSLIGFDLPSCTRSMLAPPHTSTPLPVVVDEGQNNSLNRFDFPSYMDSMPPLASPTSSQQECIPAPVAISERECITVDEEGTVIIWRCCESA